MVGGGFAYATGGLGIIPGGLVALHGGDNCVAGWNQLISGEIYDPFTMQILEKAGMSNEAASITNDLLSAAGIGAAGTVIASGQKIITTVSSVIQSGARLATNLTQESSKQGGRKHIVPDETAIGAHTVIRRNPSTGKVTHYETYILQTNPKNPAIWEFVKRFDNSGVLNQRHFNKVLKEYIYEPHIHDPLCPGGVRPANICEIPY